MSTSTLAPATRPQTLAEQADLTLASVRAPRSLWSNAWRQFRRNKMAMVGVAFLIFLTFVAVFAPAIAPHNPVQTDVRTAGQYRQAAWIEHRSPTKSGTWDYPLGTDSIGKRDYSMIMGTAIFYAALIAFANVFVDLSYGFIDPRIRVRR